jgi:uncharacterized coiled-coil DUF342 family protein
MQNNNNNFMEIINKWKNDTTIEFSLNMDEIHKQINETNNQLKNIDITNTKKLKEMQELIEKIDKTGMELILEIQNKIRDLPKKSQYEALKKDLEDYKNSQTDLIKNISNNLNAIQLAQYDQNSEINNIKQILGKYQNPDQIEQEIKKILNSTTVINTIVQENRALKDKIKRLENKIEEYYHRMESKGVDFENLESEVQKQRNILLLLTKSHTNDLFMRSNYTF